MSTFTYKKVSYLNDPYQQYLMNKSKSEVNKPNNNQYLSPDSIKKDHRTTKLLLDVKEFGAFSNLDKRSDINDIVNKNNGLLTPPSPNLNKNTSIPNIDSTNPKNGLLEPSSPKINNNLLAPPLSNIEKNTSITEIDNKTTSTREVNLSDSVKAQKHSSFLNPLLNMNFDVGGLFGEEDKNGDDLFGAILSKYDKLEKESKVNHTTEENTLTENASNKTEKEEQVTETPTIGEETVDSVDTDEYNNKTIEDLKRENRISQDTITIKHRSTIKADNNIQSEDNTSIKASNTIKAEKHNSQDTIKLIQENTKRIGSFDNQLVENLNAQPTIVVDKVELGEEEEVEENTGFNPDIYKDDDKIDLSYSNDWESPWRSGKDKDQAASMKSSQSKLSAFSNFTLRSTKKLGKMSKKFYKKILKHKQSTQFPTSPLDIPSSYNEKERAFEEMILRDDTISLSLSNPNGTLISTFADKAFPLSENMEDSENNTEMENKNNFADNSFISSVSCYEDGEGLSSKKRRHRHGINFEEALKEGNEFRASLANL